MDGDFQNKPLDENELKFKIPSGIIIGGSSSSGKTTFLLKLLSRADEMFDPPPKEIIYAYGQFHEHVPLLKKAGVTIVSGLPSEEFLETRARPFLLVLDDLMLSANKKYLDDLFTKKSHHQNFSVIFITQNLFDKNLVTARQNAHYLILMRAPNSALQIRTLGTQLFAGNFQYFLDSYQDATKKAYGYIVIDIHPGSLPELRLRTDIFNNPVIYLK